MSGLHMMRKRWHSRKGKYRKRITKPKKQEGQLLLEKESENLSEVRLLVEDEEMSKDREMRTENVIQEKPRKKIVSPGILKISEIFEKTEKRSTEKYKSIGKVEVIKNRFESMMDNTSVRKAKFEIKRRQRKTPIFSEEKSTTTRRNTLEEWARKGGGVGGSAKKLDTSFKTKSKYLEKSSSASCNVNEKGSSSGHGSSSSGHGHGSSSSDRSSHRSQSVGTFVKTSQLKSTLLKVENLTPKSIHRKGSAIENTCDKIDS